MKNKSQKMILDFYYKVWVDGITKLKSRPENKGMWKFYAMVFISMAINIFLIMALLQRYITKNNFYDIEIHLFSEPKINAFISFFILYLLLPVLIKYLLIFRNNRYEMLIGRYKTYNGKLCIAYLVISYFLPLILLLFAVLAGFN